MVVAFGDDRTDEDLFRSLPGDAVTVAVGGGAANARYSVADYRGVRDALARLLGDRIEAEAATPGD